jgi:hypothetical protein
MDCGDAIKGMLGGKTYTRKAWDGKMVVLMGKLPHTRNNQLIQMSMHGRKGAYQLTNEDLNARDWQAAL